MTLADVDRLNIIYFGEMELSDKEKAIRVKMATAMEDMVRKYLSAVQLIYESDIDPDESDGLLTLAVIAFAKEYKRFFDEWVANYTEQATGAREISYPNATAWRDEHSVDLPLWLAETAGKNPTDEIMRNVRTQVRTETNAICNLATLNIMYIGGATHKTWRTFGDNKVRGTHSVADGQRVPIDQPFIVGGYKMMFPLDSSMGAPPEEIVNCRCVMISENRE